MPETTSVPSRGSSSTGDPERRTAERDDARPIELVVIAAVAVVAGLGLRFLTRSPLWLDEALSVNIASLPLRDIPEALRHDGHPPLYYVLLHGWMRLVGEGDAAVRALSGVLAVAALPLGYLVGRRRGGPVLGLALLSLLAMSPFALRYATETRMYALVVLLVLLGDLLLHDVVVRGRAGPGRLVALALVAAALLWTHYWTMWLIGATALWLVWSWRRGPEGHRRDSGRALAALVAGGVLFLPWVPVLLWQGAHTGTPWAGPVRPTSLAAMTLTDFGGGDFTDAQLVGGVLLVLALLGVFGRSIDGRTIELDLRTVPQLRAEAVVVVGTVLLGLLVSYVTWSAFATRYASVFLPLLLLLVAGGVTRFVDRRVRAVVLAGLVLLSGLGAVYNLRTDRTQAAALAALVAPRAAPGDIVVHCPDQLGPAAMRVFPPGMEHLGYPDLTSPARIDWVDYADRVDRADPDAVARAVLERAGGRGVFVVWSGGYKTHTGTCERLVGALGQARPQQLLASEDGDTYYEHANLSWFPAAP